MPSFELTKANASKVLPKDSKKSCIVLHYMNGCIHCEMFKPVWSELAQTYKNKPEYTLISVEYGQSESMPKTMNNVQGFPTLRAYRNSMPIAEFNDTRDFETVSAFIEKYGKNAVSEKKTEGKAKTKPKAKAKAKK